MRPNVKQFRGYQVISFSALASYTGAETLLHTTDGRTYQRITSSTTADGVLLVSVAGSTTDRWQIVYTGAPLSVKFWGAVGDGSDDTTAISNALNSAAPAISFPKTSSYYKITNLITVSNLNTKRIFADGATILNSDLTKQSFLFTDCQNVSIFSGLWGNVTMPTANSGGSQHVFQFQRCTNTLLNGVAIDKSGEMGVAFTNCNGYLVTKCTISHTMRDGVYSRYCANGKVVFSSFSDIKDDAISFHDKDNTNAGVDAEKTTTLVNVYGYNQATNFTAAYNTFNRVYQGIVSVGGANVEIVDNTINSTVLAAICVYNQKNDDPAGIFNALIAKNRITGACSTTTINGTSYDNNGQSGAGRAAIFVGSTGTNNQINAGETKRLAHVKLFGNTVFSSGANGFWCNLTDGLELDHNKFLNTVGADPAHSGAGMGTVVEIQNCTYLNVTDNEVTDNRGTIKHLYGYNLFNTTGYSDRWVVNNFLTGESILNGTTVVTNMASRQVMPQPLPFIDSASLTDWNTYVQCGTRQVSGASIAASPNNPFGAGTANAGTLDTRISLGTLVQTYTDYLGNQVFRHQNGLGTTTWSAWAKVHTNLWFPVKGMTPADNDTLTWNATTSQWENKNPSVRYNFQTGTTYTVTEADNGRLIILTNSAAITLTLAPGLSSGWNAVIEQGGAGQVTWSNGTGVTNNVYPSGTKTAAIRARVTLENRGSNTFYLNGQMA